jgi:two-component system, NtrC family, sensor kinase
MRQRGGSEQSVKGGRANRPKARVIAATSIADLQKQVATLTRELKAAREQQTATADILKVISRSAFNLQSVLDTLVETAARLCKADRATLSIREGDVYRFVAMFAHEEEFFTLIKQQTFAPGRGTVTGRTALEGKAVHIADLAADPEYTGPTISLTMGKTRTILGVPLLRDGVVMGTLNLARQRVEPFSERQIELVQTFADQAVIAIENARLFDEVQARTRDLEESLQQQTATADVLEVISRSTFDLQKVLDTLAESSCRLCGAYDAVIVLREGEFLRIAAHCGEIPVVDKWPVSRDWISGRAVVDRKPVHVHDLLAEEAQFPLAHAFAQKTGHRTTFAVPLLREGESIGAIVLRRTEVHPFSEKQIALLQTFADQAVIAIQNVKLLDEVQAKTRDLQEALTYQTGSANILRVIASSPTDVGPVLQAIVESACDLCDAYDAVVMLREGDELRLGAHHGPIPMSRQRWASDRGSISGRAIANRQPVHVRDVLSDEGDEFAVAREMSLRDGCHTLLGAPLLREGEAIGAIVLRRAEVHPFSEKQTALLQTFADQAVIAIGNTQLFEQVQARTRELAKSLEDLRTAQDRLIQTEKLASLGQLTAGIAHEIKNPLNFVNNFAALSAELTDELKDVLKPAGLDEIIRAEVNELTGNLKDNLGKVVQHGKRADSIVKNMLLHSREGSGERRSVDINALVRESLNLAYHGARAEKAGFGITLKHDFDPEAGVVDLYPQEITRALLNLISNGFYAATRRKVELGDEAFEPALSAATKNLGKVVEIRIRDNGTGILPEVREKMFNPFYTTKPTGEGTGLGLSITHDIIVKQHGGRIDVQTELGVFTEFIITLPRENGTTAYQKMQ